MLLVELLEELLVLLLIVLAMVIAVLPAALPLILPLRVDLGFSRLRLCQCCGGLVFLLFGIVLGGFTVAEFDEDLLWARVVELRACGRDGNCVLQELFIHDQGLLPVFHREEHSVPVWGFVWPELLEPEVFCSEVHENVRYHHVIIR